MTRPVRAAMVVRRRRGRWAATAAVGAALIAVAAVVQSSADLSASMHSRVHLVSGLGPPAQPAASNLQVLVALVPLIAAVGLLCLVVAGALAVSGVRRRRRQEAERRRRAVPVAPPPASAPTGSAGAEWVI